VLRGCEKGLERVRSMCKDVRGLLYGCYKGVIRAADSSATRMLKRCHKNVARVSQGCCKGHTRAADSSAMRVLERCYEGITSML
jgi:hypothetical protein